MPVFCKQPLENTNKPSLYRPIYIVETYWVKQRVIFENVNRPKRIKTVFKSVKIRVSVLMLKITTKYLAETLPPASCNALTFK